ncbi:MAG: hypothetical protein HY735_07755 [Verrucomicrobia bacterium]|nr:hypothetical protein [Verrucomicrobiota bacterium]
MSAQEIIEQIKTLPLEQRRAVLKFLSEDLQEDTPEKQADDRKTLRRLGEVFGGKRRTAEG